MSETNKEKLYREWRVWNTSEAVSRFVTEGYTLGVHRMAYICNAINEELKTICVNNKYRRPGPGFR